MDVREKGRNGCKRERERERERQRERDRDRDRDRVYTQIHILKCIIS